jgi:hypothetical protein
MRLTNDSFDEIGEGSDKVIDAGWYFDCLILQRSEDTDTKTEPICVGTATVMVATGRR